MVVARYLKILKECVKDAYNVYPSVTLEYKLKFKKIVIWIKQFWPRPNFEREIRFVFVRLMTAGDFFLISGQMTSSQTH